MNIDVTITGDRELINKLDLLKRIDTKKVLLKCGMVVLRHARLNVTAQVKGEYTTGRLKNSTNVLRSDSKECVVGTNVFYAPYVEFGTGKFSSMGKGRSGWWVYVKGSDGHVTTHGRREYTKEEARKVMAILCSKGLDAHMTEGRHPKPFLKPAIDNHDAEIRRIAADEITKEAREICSM